MIERNVRDPETYSIVSTSDYAAALPESGVRMKNSSPLFFEYKEIRRRVERQLGSANMLIGHLVMFFMAVIATISYFSPTLYFQGTFQLAVSGMLMLWSFALAGHGFLVYRTAGASGRARELAINRQLEERLTQGDTELLNNPRDVFRIHGLLEDDIRKRSGTLLALLSFLVLNAAGWLIYIGSSGESLYPWNLLAFAFLILTPALIINFLRRWLRERRYAALFSYWAAQPEVGRTKEKRREDDAALRLSDDGELIEAYQMDISKPKRTVGSNNL